MSGCACTLLNCSDSSEDAQKVENEDTCLITAMLAFCCLGPLDQAGVPEERERGRADRATWVITRQSEKVSGGIWSEDGSQGLQPSKQESAMLTITQ